MSEPEYTLQNYKELIKAGKDKQEIQEVQEVNNSAIDTEDANQNNEVVPEATEEVNEVNEVKETPSEEEVDTLEEEALSNEEIDSEKQEVDSETTEEVKEVIPEEKKSKRNRSAEAKIAQLVKERAQLEGQVALLKQQASLSPAKRQEEAKETQYQFDHTLGLPPDPTQYTDVIEYQVDFKIYERNQQAKIKSFEKNVIDLEKIHPDILELKHNALVNQIPSTPTMTECIIDSDVSGELYYYLLSHQDEALKIAKLSPTQTIKALTKIEMTLISKKEGKTEEKKIETKTSKAPAPITPVKTSKSIPVKKTNYGFTVY